MPAVVFHVYRIAAAKELLVGSICKVLTGAAVELICRICPRHEAARAHCACQWRRSARNVAALAASGLRAALAWVPTVVIHTVCLSFAAAIRYGWLVCIEI